MSDIKFTPTNLALIGALDDFYNLYCETKNVYELHRKNYAKENAKKYPLLSKTWDELCLRDVRKLFEPYLNKYLYLFSNGYDKFYSCAYAFQDFSFIDRDKSVSKFNSESPFILSFKSFSDFLIEFLIVVTVLDYRYNYINDSRYTIQQSWKRINSNIGELADNIRDESCNVSDATYTNDTLYIFDRLSNVSCYKSEHPIISARYVATVARTAQKISLPVHYCDYCKKYFIGSKTLAVFEKTFGKLIIEKKDISEMEFKFGCFSAESKLHSLGYNVIKGNLSEEERERLLIYLLENRHIRYVELCSTIEQNIGIFKNSYRHKKAVEKWRHDLKYIGNYIIKYPEKKN